MRAVEFQDNRSNEKTDRSSRRGDQKTNDFRDRGGNRAVPQFERVAGAEHSGRIDRS